MTQEYRSDVMEITPSQKKASGVVSLCLLAGLVVWLVLVACGVTKAEFGRVVVGSVLGFVALSLLFTGLIEKNSVSLWLAFSFLIPSAMALLCTGYGVLSYAQWYPSYIAIPALASLAVLPLARAKGSLLKVALAFGIETGCYLLSVFGVVKLWLSVTLGCVWAVAVVVYILIALLRSKNQ